MAREDVRQLSRVSPNQQRFLDVSGDVARAIEYNRLVELDSDERTAK
jgi:hypothetical protein